MDLKVKVSEDICELNCWKTPPRIKAALGRNLTESEIKTVMTILETYVPYKDWVKTWKGQDGAVPQYRKT